MAPETTQGKGNLGGRNRNPGEAPNLQAPTFSLQGKEQWLAVNAVSPVRGRF